MITRPAPIALRSENGAPAPLRAGAWAYAPLLATSRKAPGQDDGLDQLHLNLDSCLLEETHSEEDAGRNRPRPASRDETPLASAQIIT